MISPDIINTTAKVLQEWCNEATFEMQRLLKTRLKQNSQISSLAESIDFTGTTITSEGTTAIWNLNDYWIYIDLGVKGVVNRSKTFPSTEIPSGFKFKNLHVSSGMLKSMQSYVARKGIHVDNKKGQSNLEASWQTAYGMAVAVKRKGIDGTRFYSDVFNAKGFKRLTDKLETALGQEIELRIIQDLK